MRFIKGEAYAEATDDKVVKMWEYKWRLIFGWLQRIYSDNRSYFKNAVVEATAGKYSTDLKYGLIFHLQSTGLIERTVRLVKNQMMK